MAVVRVSLVGALLCLLCAVLSAEGATPVPIVIRSRGAKRAFGGNRPTRSRTVLAPISAAHPTVNFSPSPSPTPSPSPSSLASPSSPVTRAAAASPATQLTTPAPSPALAEAAARSFTPLQRSSPGFSPKPVLGFSPQPLPQSFARPRQAASSGFSGARPRGNTPIPIVALKFNLREDGSYTTSSETGDGTVRQERGDFNGAGMAVQGMYSYRDIDQGPVQVNYVADEYGFQPQGPSIHPAILQAVAEQVKLARSAKSRMGAAGLNGLQDEDYDDTPSTKTKSAVRKVVVRRL